MNPLEENEVRELLGLPRMVTLTTFFPTQWSHERALWWCLRRRDWQLARNYFETCYVPFAMTLVAVRHPKVFAFYQAAQRWSLSLPD